MQLLKTLYDKHFPQKTILIKPSTDNNPWITSGIIKSIKRKNKLYRAKLKSPTGKNIKSYSSYHNKLNYLIRATKNEYYNNLINNAKGNLISTWKIINELREHS